MSTATDTVEELKILQREAGELAESRKRVESVKVKENEQPQGNQSTGVVEEGRTDLEEPHHSEPGYQEIADQIEMYLKEIEEAALERPALALLATFAVGVIVGHLFSRR